MKDYNQILEKRISTSESIKGLSVIITGLTITNSILVLLTKGSYSKIYSLDDSIFEKQFILFLVLLISLLRFYHGNIRLLDDNYKVCKIPNNLTDRLNFIYVDFFVVLITGILHAFMSFYLFDFFNFFILLLFILSLDIGWFFLTMKGHVSNKIFAQKKKWTINNIVLLLIATPVLTIAKFYENTGQNDINGFVILCLIVSLNAIFDFWISWEFYFPSLNSGSDKAMIFVAAPFTNIIDNLTNRTEADFTQSIKKLIHELRKKGFSVFSAHEEEGWGKNLLKPDFALTRDINNVSNSNLIIAFIGNPPSPGVQLEIGAALAIGKPIICMIKKGDFTPYLIRGIETVIPNKICEYESYEDAYFQILEVADLFIDQKLVTKPL